MTITLRLAGIFAALLAVLNTQGIAVAAPITMIRTLEYATVGEHSLKLDLYVVHNTPKAWAHRLGSRRRVARRFED